MAIDAHVDVLKEGAQIWNDWRAERPESVQTFQAADFAASTSGTPIFPVSTFGNPIFAAPISMAPISKAQILRAPIYSRPRSTAPT